MITSDGKTMMSPALLHLETLKIEAAMKLRRLYKEALKKKNGFWEKNEKSKIFSEIISGLYSEYSYRLGFLGNPREFRSVIILKKNDIEREERISFAMSDNSKVQSGEIEFNPDQNLKSRTEVFPELFPFVETGAEEIKLKQKRKKIRKGIFSPEFNSKKRARFSRREEKETTF